MQVDQSGVHRLTPHALVPMRMSLSEDVHSHFESEKVEQRQRDETERNKRDILEMNKVKNLGQVSFRGQKICTQSGRTDGGTAKVAE
jgi:hypothetical protein